GGDHRVRLPDAAVDFGSGKRVQIFQHHPLVSSNIWSGDNSLILDQLEKFSGIAFEYEPLWNPAQANHGKYFAPDLKTKFILPLQLLGGVSKRETQSSQGVEIHSRQSFVVLKSLKPARVLRPGSDSDRCGACHDKWSRAPYLR